nr:HAD family hydrolase [candidate division Zixibacteria bacterium]
MIWSRKYAGRRLSKENNSMAEIKGVLFDLGSTLLEYETIPWEELNIRCFDAGYSFLVKDGIDVPPRDVFWEKHLEIRQNYRKYAADTLREWNVVDALNELLKSVGINGEKSLAEIFFRAFYQPISRQLSLFADSQHILRELKQRGFKIGLVSNTIFPADYHLDELKKYGLLPYFDFTIFSSSFGFRKPHPSIYQHALKLIDLPPENLVFVGDRYQEDCLGPQKMGIRPILKYREGRDYPDPLPSDLTVIKSLSELPAHIGV